MLSNILLTTAMTATAPAATTAAAAATTARPSVMDLREGLNAKMLLLLFLLVLLQLLAAPPAYQLCSLKYQGWAVTNLNRRGSWWNVPHPRKIIKNAVNASSLCMCALRIDVIMPPPSPSPLPTLPHPSPSRHPHALRKYKTFWHPTKASISSVFTWFQHAQSGKHSWWGGGRQLLLLLLLLPLLQYYDCGWKKSCTTLYTSYPETFSILGMISGARFPASKAPLLMLNIPHDFDILNSHRRQGLGYLGS